MPLPVLRRTIDSLWRSCYRPADIGTPTRLPRGTSHCGIESGSWPASTPSARRPQCRFGRSETPRSTLRSPATHQGSIHPPGRFRQVTPGWLEAMGIKVASRPQFRGERSIWTGRCLDHQPGSAERYLPGRNPLEAGLALGGFGTREEPNPVLPIVGVIGDVNYATVSERAEPTVYAIGRA